MGNSSTKTGILNAGTITVQISEGLRWKDIFGFGERVNPKRAFLFVSNVLGRHVPVKPHLVSRAFVSLAETIPTDLPGPILVTGMAETAIGLGAGVHDALLRMEGRSDVLYLSTTRAKLAGELLVEFCEEHSHASDQLVYHPQHLRDKELLMNARSLVMVDDEISTGNTCRNLAQALIEKATPNIRRIHTAVLTDWSSAPISLSGKGMPDVVATRSSLVSGNYDWESSQSESNAVLPDKDILRSGLVRPIERKDDARLGRSQMSSYPNVSQIISVMRRRGDKRVSVIGTGEHVWEPFLIAEELEDLGYNVVFSATTRSPIRIGHAIKSGYVFSDHEGLGIKNYLYNVEPADFDAIIVCLDTDKDAVDPRLLKALGADVLIGDTFHTREELAISHKGVESASRIESIVECT